MINIANFPSFADAATRYPTYAAHMRDLHARNVETVRSAVEAGVAVHAGTDAGGFVAHGRVADEVAAMAEVLGAPEALVAAAHGARELARPAQLRARRARRSGRLRRGPGADPACAPRR